MEIRSGYGTATRPSQKVLAPKTDEFDDDGIEKPLTRITGIEADRHQPSGSADEAIASASTRLIGRTLTRNSR